MTGALYQREIYKIFEFRDFQWLILFKRKMINNLTFWVCFWIVKKTPLLWLHSQKSLTACFFLARNLTNQKRPSSDRSRISASIWENTVCKQEIMTWINFVQWRWLFSKEVVFLLIVYVSLMFPFWLILFQGSLWISHSGKGDAILHQPAFLEGYNRKTWF